MLFYSIMNIVWYPAVFCQSRPFDRYSLLPRLVLSSDALPRALLSAKERKLNDTH